MSNSNEHAGEMFTIRQAELVIEHLDDIACYLNVIERLTKTATSHHIRSQVRSEALYAGVALAKLSTILYNRIKGPIDAAKEYVEPTGDMSDSEGPCETSS